MKMKAPGRYPKNDRYLLLAAKKRLLIKAIVCVGMIAALQQPIIPAYANAGDAGFPASSVIAAMPQRQRAGISRSAASGDGPQWAGTLPVHLADNTHYVSLYDFSTSLGPAVVTQGANSITVDAPKLYISASVGHNYLIANERGLFVPTLVRLINGQVHIPLQTATKAFGAEVVLNTHSNTVTLPEVFSPIEHGDTYYDQTDVYWLSRIISLESRHESMSGRIAVGNVIVNRMNSSLFPDSIMDVILDNRHGVQFPPAHTERFHTEPNRASVIAAMLVLEGAMLAEGCLYFNPRGAQSWASRNRPFLMTIDSHDFYG